MAAIGVAVALGPPAVLLAIQSLPCGETLANGGWQAYALAQCVLRYPIDVCLGIA